MWSCHVTSCHVMSFHVMSTSVMFARMQHYWCFMCNYPPSYFLAIIKQVYDCSQHRGIFSQYLVCLIFVDKEYRFRMKTPVTESKPTMSGMVWSNNDRDSVRLHGYNPPSTPHTTHPGTVQNGSNSKFFKTNCVSRLEKNYAEKCTLILYF